MTLEEALRRLTAEEAAIIRDLMRGTLEAIGDIMLQSGTSAEFHCCINLREFLCVLLSKLSTQACPASADAGLWKLQ